MARYWLSILITLLLPLGTPAVAQEQWNAVQKATGWAAFDRDGSCYFYEPSAKQLINWSWEGGVLGQLDLAKASPRPEKWVVDSINNVWCVAGTALQMIEKNGKPGTSFTLPAEVGDLAWDARSFVLCYRTQGLYLEKRDIKTGNLVWSFGAKPVKGGSFPQTLHRLAIQEDGQILVASGASLALTTLEGSTGKVLGSATFTYEGAPPPLLNLGQQDRGGLQWWLGNGTAVVAVSASQAPAFKQEGLFLLKLDLSTLTATCVATGLSETHTLVGMLEKLAVFRIPSGGLAFVTLE